MYVRHIIYVKYSLYKNSCPHCLFKLVLSVRFCVSHYVLCLTYTSSSALLTFD